MQLPHSLAVPLADTNGVSLYQTKLPFFCLLAISEAVYAFVCACVRLCVSDLPAVWETLKKNRELSLVRVGLGARCCVPLHFSVLFLPSVYLFLLPRIRHYVFNLTQVLKIMPLWVMTLLHKEVLVK